MGENERGGEGMKQKVVEVDRWKRKENMVRGMGREGSKRQGRGGNG